MAKDQKKAEYMKQYRAKKKAEQQAQNQARQPAPQRRPNSSSDPVGDWMAQAAAENSLPADLKQRYLQGQVTHQEAEKLWFQAHKDQNAWGDLL